MNKNLLSKTLALGVVVLFIGIIIAPSITGFEERKYEQIESFKTDVAPGEYTFENVYVQSAGYYSNGYTKITFKCFSLMYHFIINLFLRGTLGWASGFFKLFLPIYWDIGDSSFSITADFTEEFPYYGTSIFDNYGDAEPILHLCNQKYTITAKYNAKSPDADHASFNLHEDIVTGSDIIIVRFHGIHFEQVTVIVPEE